ncbi:MAG: LysM peptidoglycan-binding domain-containing protein [Anaerolineales bacterium]
MARKKKNDLVGDIGDAVEGAREKAEEESRKKNRLVSNVEEGLEDVQERLQKKAADEKRRAAEKARSQAAQAKTSRDVASSFERTAATVGRQKEKQAEDTRIYVVKPGDSLSKIAKELYDDAHRWPEIYEANRDKIDNPNLIRPGQELVIP